MTSIRSASRFASCSAGALPARSLLFVAMALALSACSLAPEHRVPDLGVAATPDYREEVSPALAALPWKRVEGDAAIQSAEGRWEIFALPELPGLLAKLEADNANLANYRARYVQATALIGQVRAGWLPSVSVNGSATRGRAAGASNPTVSDSLSLAASWEVDLWGRIGNTVAANEASAKAGAADLAAMRLSLQAQLVQALLSLRVVDAQRQLLEASAADYERYLQLTADRVRFGVASKSDLAQAESQLRSVQSQAIDTGVQRATLEHAIAVLVGELPSRFKLPETVSSGASLRAPLRSSEPQSNSANAVADARLGSVHASIFERVPQLPAVPLTAPSTLLERRPDIAAAERRAAAANAQIGVANAAFFPVFSLAANGGNKAASLPDLFQAPARFWSIGPALAAPLFDGGLRSSQKAQAVGVWEQSIATYRQTVLAAFQEVEDQLATLRVLADEAQVQSEAVKAARTSAELTLAQYRAGTTGSLQVIVANSALLSAERSALDVHNRRLTAAVTLLRALGGGWAQEGGAE